MIAVGWEPEVGDQNENVLPAFVVFVEFLAVHDSQAPSWVGQRVWVGVALFFLGSDSLLLLQQLVCSFSSHG